MMGFTDGAGPGALSGAGGWTGDAATLYIYPILLPYGAEEGLAERECSHPRAHLVYYYFCAGKWSRGGAIGESSVSKS